MKKKKRKRRLKISHIVLLFLMIYIAVIMLNQRKLMKNLESKKIKIQEEIHIIQKDINHLNRELEESDSLEFIEKTAREELGMVKPREIIYIDEEKKDNSFFRVFKKDSN